MNIARSGVSGMLAPLQDFWRWVTPTSTQVQTGESIKINLPHGNSISTKARYASNAPEVMDSYTARKPLRIVRILEANQPTSMVGRMVMSGSMADVCAELDRLAARDCVLH